MDPNVDIERVLFSNNLKIIVSTALSVLSDDRVCVLCSV